jgi:hypothetical protein
VPSGDFFFVFTKTEYLGVFLCFSYRAFSYIMYFNPLNAELNPICHLLALLEAHHILHISRIRVKQENVSCVP